MTASSGAPARDLLETDVCIVGAGPAGIAVARELMGSSLRVTLLESGGFVADPLVEELDRGTIDAPDFLSDALAQGRDRRFGGTTNMWIYDTEPSRGGGYARALPPEPLDLEQREGPDGSGWPFTFDSLRQYYERAQSTWNGAPFDYAVGSWTAEASPIALTGGGVETRICQHGPSEVFTHRYRDDLLAAENVTVLTGSTVARLGWDDLGRSVRRVHVVRTDGSSFGVSARVVVLAAGGVENVQLLLLSEPDRPIATASDHLGRHITDHPEFRIGTFASSDPELPRKLGLYDLRWVGRFMIGAFLTLTEERKRAEGLRNFSAVLTPRGAGFGSPAHRSLAALLAMRNGERPADVLSELRTFVESPRDTLALFRGRRLPYREFHGGWSASAVDPRRFPVIELHGSSEQTPSRDNRIVLADGRDSIGRRRAHLRWRWSAEDRDSVRRSIRILADDIEASGLGRFSPWVEFEGPLRPIWNGIHHPMGGTRMHEDPALGVVDPEGLVHGTEGLYIAGSSVFPNGHGYANPTLTILALSIRLADHLKTVLA
jgi:choline dehydrogenase-like flavoprotein